MVGLVEGLVVAVALALSTKVVAFVIEAIVVALGMPMPVTTMPGTAPATVLATTGEQAAAIDRATIAGGVPSRALMQRAGTYRGLVEKQLVKA